MKEKLVCFSHEHEYSPLRCRAGEANPAIVSFLRKRERERERRQRWEVRDKICGVLSLSPSRETAKKTVFFSPPPQK